MISANPYELMLPYIYTIFWVILAIAIPLIVMKIIVKALSKYDDEDATEKTLIKRIISIIHYMTVILIIISILSILGIDLQSLILSLGLASVAVSLAAKDTLSNIISGVIIILEKKFKVGDLIEIDGQMGRVIKIGIKSVELEYKTKYISIPNVVFSTKSLVNYTKYGVYPETFQINLRNDYDFEEKIPNSLVTQKEVCSFENKINILLNFEYNTVFPTDILYIYQLVDKTDSNKEITKLCRFLFLFICFSKKVIIYFHKKSIQINLIYSFPSNFFNIFLFSLFFWNNY
jgi:small conductance mechanosensitive channel